MDDSPTIFRKSALTYIALIFVKLLNRYNYYEHKTKVFIHHVDLRYVSGFITTFYHIVTYLVTIRGVRLVMGFIGHLQNVTAGNYFVIAN
jgi:hypothetical protein